MQRIPQQTLTGLKFCYPLLCIIFAGSELLWTSPVLAAETYETQFANILNHLEQSQQAWKQGHYDKALELNASAETQTEAVLQALRQLPDNAYRRNQSSSATLNLANIYQNQSQILETQATELRFQNVYDKAETLQEQAVALGQKALATQQQAADLLKTSPYAATTPPKIQQQITTYETYEFMQADKLKDLAIIYQAQERHPDAARLLDGSRTLLERSEAHIPPEHNTPAATTDPYVLATQYLQEGKLQQAIPLLHQALALAQAAPELKTGIALEANLHKLLLPMTLNSLAQAYVSAGQYPEAQQYFEQNLALPDNHLPPSHPGSKAYSLDGLATLHKLTNQIPKALEYMRLAYAQYDAYPSPDREQANAKQEMALTHLSILRRGLANGQLQPAQALPEAFRAAQLAHGSTRLEAFRQIALRLAADKPAIREQLQTLWDKQTHLQTLDRQYATSLSNLSNPTPQAVAVTEHLQQEMQQTLQAIQQLEQKLAASFPAYTQLAHPEPLSLEQAQALLQPDEALLVWVEASTAPAKSTLLVVRSNRQPAMHELDINREVLQQALTDPAIGLRTALTNPQQPFNLTLAHGLYQQLLAPAEQDLEGVHHIIAVSDGSLQNLPLHVLVKSLPPTTQTPTNADYANADWLARHYAFSYLPAAHALADLRKSGTAVGHRSASNRSPFLGFGDPLLTGNSQQLASLPDTTTEIREIARLLGADPQTSVYLAENATETRLKQLDSQGELKRFNVISFATHALLPSDSTTDPAQERREAGLVLTPPSKSSAEDDGYLSTSEIATLKLDADWVLLSACNTGTLASGDAHEGLSSLSKAFFMAGTRSVLASHWSVGSRVTAQLMTGLFDKLRNNPDMRRAEALRRSMLALVDAPAECNWLCWLGLQNAKHPTAHPAYWAAFVVYGEGGAIP